jgi:hypothetical protein
MRPGSFHPAFLSCSSIVLSCSKPVRGAGRAGETRTRNHPLWGRALFQLSYVPLMFSCCCPADSLKLPHRPAVCQRGSAVFSLTQKALQVSLQGFRLAGCFPGLARAPRRDMRPETLGPALGWLDAHACRHAIYDTDSPAFCQLPAGTRVLAVTVHRQVPFTSLHRIVCPVAAVPYVR